MRQFTVTERVFIVKTWERTGSYVTVQNEFVLEFPDGRAAPVKNTIKKLVNKFSNRGTVHNQNAFLFKS